ncbi:MAG TPA: hypothetical protein PKW21_00070 [Rhabdaerophilum sp.]|nr:hypothetical protein [Rhabdaerophilum sp.]
MRGVQIYLAGPLRVVADDGKDLTPSTQKARAILGILAVAPAGRRSRAFLIDHLWSGKAKAQAQMSLRQSLREIRKSFGEFASELIEADHFVVTLNIAKVKPLTGEGDFLEGIDIDDPEFEDWLRIERRNREVSIKAKVDKEAQTDAGSSARRYALRIDPPIASVDRIEEAHIAGRLLDRIIVSLAEEGFSEFHDRRPGSPLAFSGTPVAAAAVDVLRCSVACSSDMVHIVLALVNLATGRVLLMRTLDLPAGSLRLDSLEALDTLVIEFSERIWREREAFSMRARMGDSETDIINAAIQDMFALGVSDLDRAEAELRALLRSPFGALAAAWLAFLLTFRVGQRFVDHSSALHDEARMLMASALERAPGNALVLALSGHVQSYLFGNYVRAQELLDHAVRINPSRALGWDLYAVLQAYVGNPRAGLQFALKARSLGAFSPYRYYFDVSCLVTASMSGEHRLAIRHGEAALQERQSFNSALRFLAASYGHLGEGRHAGNMRDRLMALEPTFSLDALREARYPGLETPAGRYFLSGLKKAGF